MVDRLLSITEQKILLSMLIDKKKNFNFKNQKLIKDKSNFYRIMNLMNEKGLVNKITDNSLENNFYTLTDFGHGLAEWLNGLNIVVIY